MSSEVTSLLFVYVCDTDVTSGFASEPTSKLDSLDSRMRIRIRLIQYGLRIINARGPKVLDAEKIRRQCLKNQAR